MRSWITFLLPSDEYKEKRMLYFFSEGGCILVLSLIAFLLANKLSFIPNLNLETVLLSAIAIFILYVSGRYILSGIEYAEIATKAAYKKELRDILIKISGFIGIFMLLYMIFVEVPASSEKWLDILGLLLGTSIVWFLASYLSLRNSYKKNKDLL